QPECRRRTASGAAPSAGGRLRWRGASPGRRRSRREGRSAWLPTLPASMMRVVLRWRRPRSVKRSRICKRGFRDLVAILAVPYARFPSESIIGGGPDSDSLRGRTMGKRFIGSLVVLGMALAACGGDDDGGGDAADTEVQSTAGGGDTSN